MIIIMFLLAIVWISFVWREEVKFKKMCIETKMDFDAAMKKANEPEIRHQNYLKSQSDSDVDLYANES